MDRFLNEDNIVKKKKSNKNIEKDISSDNNNLSNTDINNIDSSNNIQSDFVPLTNDSIESLKNKPEIQQVIQKAQMLKDKVQQKLDTLSPDQKNALIANPEQVQFTKAEANEMFSNLMQQADSILSADTKSNFSSTESSFNKENTIALEDNKLDLNLSENIYNTNEGPDIDPLPQPYYKQSLIPPKQNNIQNYSEDSLSNDNQIKNNITYINENDKNIVAHKQYLAEINKNGVKENEKQRNMVNKNILITKQKEAYNLLSDYQIELKICSKMVLTVDKKLRPVYENRLKEWQNKIKEQEQRISVINDLLSYN